MSIHCTSRIWDQTELTGNAKLLMLAIADFADDTGFAFPGQQTLAAKTGISGRHVRRLISRLQAAGELLVFPRNGRGSLYIVLTGTNRQDLAAALDRAAAFGATVDSAAILSRTFRPIPELALSASDRACPERSDRDTLSAVGDEPRTPCPGTPDILSPTPDTLSSTPDIAMSSDPSLSVIDPSLEGTWIQTLSALKLTMARGTFNHCLLGSRPLAFDGETLTVEARYNHAVPRLENRLAPVIARVAAFYLPGIQVRFVPAGTQPATRTTQPAPDQPSPTAPNQRPAAHPTQPAPANPASPKPESTPHRPTSIVRHRSSAVPHPTSIIPWPPLPDSTKHRRQRHRPKIENPRPRGARPPPPIPNPQHPT